MDDFRAMLRALGIGRGDLLYVHSSFSRLKRFAGSADTLLGILQDSIGPEGTLVMPSFIWNICPDERPWVGYERFFEAPRLFDVRESPCNMGWLAERFRQMADVKRSSHGFWPVCAGGPLADELTRSQEDVGSPYGGGSTFRLLLERGAKIVGLGVTLNTTSLSPLVDWELGERHPQRIFTEHPKEIAVRTTSGTIQTMRTHTMLPESVRTNRPSVMFSLSNALAAGTKFLDLDGSYFFAYPSMLFHMEALRHGRECTAANRSMPWFAEIPLKRRV